MTLYRPISKKVAPNAKIRVAGNDRKGIIAAVTQYLFKNECNIEDIDQRIFEGYLIMNMLVDMRAVKNEKNFLAGLKQVGENIQCTIEFKREEASRLKRVALLVTKENHCVLELAKGFKKGVLKGIPVVMIGNVPDLKPLAKKLKIPFYSISSEKKEEHEAELIRILQESEIDLIVLARYMQILSPEFVFRYEGRIINIHPSLLPAFPGPRAYHQAYNKGVEVAGVTAHFVTTNLDEGPIIAQGSFSVDKTCDTVDDLIRQGKILEAKVLTKAVKLFLEDRLVLRRGKVLDSKKDHCLVQTAKKFYE